MAEKAPFRPGWGGGVDVRSTGSECGGSEVDGQVGGGGVPGKGFVEVGGMKRGDCEGCGKGGGKGMGRRGKGGAWVAQLEGGQLSSSPPLPPLPSYHTLLIGSKAHERRVNGRLFHMAPDPPYHPHLSHDPLSLCRLQHAEHPTTLLSAAPPGPVHGPRAAAPRMGNLSGVTCEGTRTCALHGDGGRGGRRVCPSGAEMLVGSNWTRYGPGATLRWNFLKGRVLATDAPVARYVDAPVARRTRGSTVGRVAQLSHSSSNVFVYALSNWCGAFGRQTEEACGRLVGAGGHVAVSLGGGGGGVWAVGSWVDNVPVLVAAALCLVLLVVVCVCVCVCVWWIGARVRGLFVALQLPVARVSRDTQASSCAAPTVVRARRQRCTTTLTTVDTNTVKVSLQESLDKDFPSTHELIKSHELTNKSAHCHAAAVDSRGVGKKKKGEGVGVVVGGGGTGMCAGVGGGVVRSGAGKEEEEGEEEFYEPSEMIMPFEPLVCVRVCVCERERERESDYM
jgi:hypothetical protein